MVPPRHVALACAFLFVLLVPGTALAATDYASTILEDDPTVYLRLGETAGSVAPNLGRHGGSGSIQGTPELGVYGALESDVSGDRAIRMHGDDYVRVFTEPGATLIGDYTVEAWVKIDRFTDGNLFDPPSRLTMSDGAIGTFNGAWVRPGIEAGGWHHVAMTATATQVELFVDGVSHGTTINVGTPSLYDDYTHLTVGWRLAGSVDEVAAYDKVLTAAQIAEHHRAGTEGFGAPAPVNVTPPVLTGDAVVGRTARCSDGTWTNGPREFEVRWLRDGTPIAGATRSAYVLTSADLGRVLRCEVVAKNRAGSSAPAAAATTLAVPAAPAASSYRELVLQDRPAMYLPLDERDGRVAESLGRDGGYGELNGTPQVGVYGAIESDDPSDRAVRFDGNDNLVLVPAAGARVGGDWTAEAWVQVERIAGNGSIFNNSAEWRIEQDVITTPDGPFATTLTPRTWHHVAAVAEGGEDGEPPTLELFVDGRSIGVRPSGHRLVYGDGIFQTLGWGFTGWIDEPAVYDYRLTPERIAEHHLRGSQGFGAPAPAVRTAPSVSGGPVVGATAACDEGTWSGGPRHFEYRWLRDGAPIDGATERTYAIAAHDRAKDVTCEVVARNLAGPSAAVPSSDAIVMPDDQAPATYAEMVLDDNPTTYLRLDERDGATTARNLGSHGGDARIDGDPQLGVYGALESDEPSDRAMRLDGTDSLRLRPQPGSRVEGDFTVEGWVKLDRTPTVPGTMFNHDAEVRFEQGRISTPPGRFEHALSVGEWHHVVAVSRGGDRDTEGWIELYADGERIGRLPAHRRLAYSDEIVQTMGWDLYGWLDELAIYDYRLTADRIAEHHRAGTLGFGAAAPVNRVAPSVTGDAVVGRTAVCDEGDWSGGPREFDRRWLRDGAPIEGATQRRYTLSATDLGTRISCTVVARNAAGASPVVASANALAMPARPDVGTYQQLVATDNPVMHLPLTDITGGVTANLGSHGGQAMVVGDATRAGGAIKDDVDPAVHLDGDDNVTFIPRAGEKVVGEWSVEGWVYLDRDTGDTHLFSADASLRLEPSVMTTWSGTFQPGVGSEAWHHVVMTMRQADRDLAGEMEVFVDGVSHGTRVTVADQLVYRDGFNQIFGWHLAGALDELAVYDYRLAPDRIRAHHLAGRDGIERPYPVPVTIPVVSGESRVGSTVTCDPGTWTGSPTSYDVRWTRDGTTIPGASGFTYVLTGEDAGSSVSCNVAATNALGTSVRSAATTVVVVPPAPRNVVAPTVAGSVAPGETVSCTPGVWSDAETREVMWQLSVDGVVTEAAGDTYAITAADGARLRCLVRMTGPGGTSGWVESETIVVDGNPPVVDVVCPSAPVVRGSDAVATYTASDAGRGLATPATGSIALDTSSAGTFTARTVARDLAGHAAEGACTYRVVHHRPGAPVVSSGAVPSPDGVLSLTWPTLDPAEPDAAGYELQARDADDASWTTVSSPVTRTHAYTSTSALAEGTWRFRVRAVDASFESTWSAESEPVVVDRSAPAAPTASADRAPDHVDGSGAWFRDQVTVSFASSGDRVLSDGSPGSGVDGPTLAAPVTYATSGTHTASGTVADRVGHVSAAGTLTVRVDATAPFLSVSCPDAELALGESAAATWFAYDGHSRLATPATGSLTADTSSIGDRTLEIVARDNVGHVTNRTCAYSVVFPRAVFDGSLRTDRDNDVNAGSVVPIGFDLGGDFGLDVLAGPPVVSEVACGLRSKNFRGRLAASATGLQYDAANDYRWAFRVDSAWRDTCRRVTLTLTDGTSGSWTFHVE